jgi:cytochrome d ubiquinol oxidase subunit II
VAPEILLGGVLMAALILYALGAGADFGGGVWDLLADRGARGERQRALIAEAIGPIWEANHVWLILVVVLLFACFPAAFAAIGITLHVPLTIMLVGIVLRGSAFAFRSHDGSDEARRHWSRTFAIASIVTPVMLGVCVGAVASGRIRVEPATARVLSDPVTPWLGIFPFALGAFTLGLFAFLAAVYLTVEARDDEMRESFRGRALGAAVASGALALGCLLLARDGAPRIHQGLMTRGWSGMFHAITALFAIGAIVALVLRRHLVARALAVLQVACVVAGWGLAQYPYLIDPDLTLANAAAPPSVLRAVIGALVAGALVLFPALGYLYALFKRNRDRGSARTSTPGRSAASARTPPGPAASR